MDWNLDGNRMKGTSLWWNGCSGGMTNEGKYKMWYFKPPLPHIHDAYTEIFYSDSIDVQSYYVVWKAKLPVSDVARDALYNLIVDAFLDQGGGGSGAMTTEGFFKMYAQPLSNVEAGRSPEGNLTLNTRQTKVPKTDIDIMGALMWPEGVRAHILYDGTVNNPPIMIPLGIWAGKALGWQVDKGVNVVRTPAGYTTTDGNKGIYGVDFNMKLTSSGWKPPILVKRKKVYRARGETEWKVATQYPDYTWDSTVSEIIKAPPLLTALGLGSELKSAPPETEMQCITEYVALEGGVLGKHLVTYDENPPTDTFYGRIKIDSRYLVYTDDNSSFDF